MLIVTPKERIRVRSKETDRTYIIEKIGINDKGNTMLYLDNGWWPYKRFQIIDIFTTNDKIVYDLIQILQKIKNEYPECFK